MEKGSLTIGLKDERGLVLTKKHGFTVEEENGKVLGFDLYNHPEHGICLLFGNQVFMLKFWDREALEGGVRLLEDGLKLELSRRNQ